MLLFKRILNFKREFLAKLRDKRQSVRYPVGPKFPLKAAVNLMGQDVLGSATGSTPGAGYDWGGRLLNVSSSGVALQLLRAATTTRGEQTVLKLSLEDHELSIPCAVAHYRTFASYSLCGLTLQFTDFNTQKAYLQLVEAIRIGASFAPMKHQGASSNRSGLVLEQFTADNKALLNAWRTAKGGELDSFELVTGSHGVKGGETVPPLEVFRLTKPPKIESSAEVAGEVRRLFRWVVPNLPKAVPADLRALMERASSRLIVGKGPSGGAVRSSSPPNEWKPPSAKR